MPSRLDPDPIPRRDFLGLSSLWAAGIAVCGSLLGLLRLPKPRVTPEASSLVRIGRPEDYPIGETRLLPEHQLRVLRTEAGFASVSLICTHLGCVVKELGNGFECPCHGSVFDADGAVTAGPAPSGLPWLAVSRAPDGSLVVDRSAQVPPGTFVA